MLYLHNILNGVWAIDQNYASNYLPLIANFIKGERMAVAPALPALNDRNSVMMSDGIGNENRVPVIDAMPGSIAIINISGVITKEDQMCGPAGMRSISNLMKQCYANDAISSIVIVMSSGGGEGYAMRLLAETISEKNKPVGGFIDDMACSAAYGILSGCDYICANSNLAKVGSCGAYVTLIDFSKQLEIMGVNLIEIYATASTDKNKTFIDAINGKPEELRADLDVFNEWFLSMIETNRADQLKGDRKVWGTGKVFYGDKSLEIGLIDAVDTFENFINYFNS